MKVRTAMHPGPDVSKEETPIYELYEIIDNPGMRVYDLAKHARWTHGRTHSAVTRLEKDEMIKTRCRGSTNRMRFAYSNMLI